MKYLSSIIGLTAIALITGCGTGSADRASNEGQKTAPVTLTAPAVPTASPVTTTTPNQAVKVVDIGGTQQAATSASGLNPAHGQPGHRCDIAVGAPLDSKPAPTPAVSTSTVVNTTNSTKTGVKLNPAHGQPGHRCDLAVGVPLDSKPEVIEVPMKPADGTNTPVVVNTAPAKVAPGMNPSHGQPGHRCDIAVGAPLPKQ